MKVGEETQKGFLDALASKEPTPGGGAAAAIALGQSAALVTMVANLTLGREKWSDGWAPAGQAKAVAEPILERSLELAADDIDAFDEVMAAWRLPKEEEGRSNRIQAATVRAAEVPLETAELALLLLEILPPLADSGNANTVTDAGTAALLAHASALSACLNVRVNAADLNEEGVVMTTRTEAIETAAGTLTETTIGIVHGRLRMA